MGRDLARGKLTASHLEEEMSTEFEMWDVSNFLVSRGSPVRYQKPVKNFCGLRFGPSTHLRVAVAEDIFFASKNPTQKKNNDVEDAGKLFLLSPKV